MDRTLNAFWVESARNLLTLSKHFEPFVPQSHQDVMYTLTLLGGLAEITQRSLDGLRPPLSTNLPESSAQAQVKPSPQSQPGRTETQKEIKERELLEALGKLRNSKSLQRRIAGMYTTIIRSD